QRELHARRAAVDREDRRSHDARWFGDSWIGAANSVPNPITKSTNQPIIKSRHPPFTLSPAIRSAFGDRSGSDDRVGAGRAPAGPHQTEGGRERGDEGPLRQEAAPDQEA